MSENFAPPGTGVPMSELGGLLNMLDRACHEFSGVKEQVSKATLSFTSIGADLKSICEGQNRLELTIAELQKDHKEANKEHSRGIVQHDKDILLLMTDIKACQKEVETFKEDFSAMEKNIKDLQKDMNGIFVKMAAIAGGVSTVLWLIVQGINVYDKLPHPSLLQKAGAMAPPSLARWQE